MKLPKLVLILLLCFLMGVLVGAHQWVPILLILAAPPAWIFWKKYRRTRPDRRIERQ